MNCETLRKDYLAILIIFIVVIVLLTIFLAISLVGNKTAVETNNYAIERLTVQSSNLEKANAVNAKTISNQLESSTNQLTQAQRQLNALSATLTRPTVPPRVPSPTTQNIPTSPRRNTPSILDIPINVYEESIPTFPSRSRSLYMLPEHKCRGKKSLSGTRLDRIVIPEFSSTETILSIVPHKDGLLVSSTRLDRPEHRISYVTNGNRKTNQYNVRWSEIIPIPIEDCVRMKHSNEYQYYGMSNGRGYQIRVSDSSPRIQLFEMNLDSPIQSITNSPDEILMAFNKGRQSSIVKYIDKGLMEIQKYDSPVISISNSSKGSYELISSQDGRLVLNGKETIPLDNISSATFTDEDTIFGLSPQNTQFIHSYKYIPKQGYFFISKDGYNQDIYL